MKSDINGCSQCALDSESFEKFRSRVTKAVFYQYDYRAPSGDLFSTLATTLQCCRDNRDAWLMRGMI